MSHSCQDREQRAARGTRTSRLQHEVAVALLDADTALAQRLSDLVVSQARRELEMYEIVDRLLVEFPLAQEVPEVPTHADGSMNALVTYARCANPGLTSDGSGHTLFDAGRVW